MHACMHPRTPTVNTHAPMDAPTRARAPRTQPYTPATPHTRTHASTHPHTHARTHPRASSLARKHTHLRARAHTHTRARTHASTWTSRYLVYENGFGGLQVNRFLRRDRKKMEKSMKPEA